MHHRLSGELGCEGLPGTGCQHRWRPWASGANGQQAIFVIEGAPSSAKRKKGGTVNRHGGKLSGRGAVCICSTP